MPLATLILVTALAQAQDKAEYRDNKLGLMFEYPKTWKARRDRYSAVFEIPLEGGRTASVQLYSASYKGTADDWQLIQVEFCRAQKRQMDRQWTEDYLGVPMLFTKTSYQESGKNVVGIVGLLYSSYVEKLQFRLTSPAEGAEQAENVWREALLTLHTVSGELPKTEDPSGPSVVPQVPKPTTVLKASDHPKKLERGSESIELTVDTTKFKLSVPKGWSVENGKFVNRSVSGAMTISAMVGLPEEAGQNLLTAAKTAMTEFQTVTLREDPRPESEPSGAIVGQVFRTGKGANGPLVIGSAVGYCEGIYWSIGYRSNDVRGYERDRSAINELFRLLYAERA